MNKRKSKWFEPRDQFKILETTWPVGSICFKNIFLSLFKKFNPTRLLETNTFDQKFGIPQPCEHKNFSGVKKLVFFSQQVKTTWIWMASEIFPSSLIFALMICLGHERLSSLGNFRKTSKKGRNYWYWLNFGGAAR